MSLRFRQPAVLAACLLAAAAAVAGEIPAYEDFSFPLAFSGASGGRGAEGGSLPAREDLAISFLAQDEDTWFERILARHPAAGGAIAPYTPPRADANGRDAAAPRNWLSDAIARGIPAALDPSAQDADSGDWLSGDLAEMARKRGKKASGGKARSPAGENAGEEEDEVAAPWERADADPATPSAASGAASRASDAAAAATGDWRTARNGNEDLFPADAASGGEEMPASSEMLRALTANALAGRTASAEGTDGASASQASSPGTAEKDAAPAWLQAILDAGSAPAPATLRWSAPERAETRLSLPAATPVARPAESVAFRDPVPAAGLPSAAALPAAAAEPEMPWAGAGSATAFRGAATSAPDTHAGWHGGGWEAQGTGVSGWSLPAAPAIPAPVPAARASAIPTNAALPRPSWY